VYVPEQSGGRNDAVRMAHFVLLAGNVILEP
jgi:hypothetical protein